MTDIMKILSSRGYTILLLLQHQKKPVRYNKIQKSINIQRNSLGYFIRQLSKNYLIVKRSDNIDDISGYVLTEKAHEIIIKVDKILKTQTLIRKNKPLN